MRKTIIVISLMACWLLPSIEVSAVEIDSIWAIQVISAPFNERYFSQTSPKELLKRFDREESAVSYALTPITHKDFLKFIADRIRNRKDTVASEEAYMDARIVCLIHWEEEGKVDTLSFGKCAGPGPPIMTYNDIALKLDKELLRKLGHFLPESQQQELYRYIDVFIPKHEQLVKELKKK